MDKLARAYGGQLVEAYYSFSDVDRVVLFDVADHAAAPGVALTALRVICSPPRLLLGV